MSININLSTFNKAWGRERKVCLRKYSCIMYLIFAGFFFSVILISGIFLCSWLWWKKLFIEKIEIPFFYIFKEQESLWTCRHLLAFHLCIFRLVLLFAIAIFVLSFLSFQYVYLPFKICEKYLKRKEKMLVFQNPIIMHFQICQTHLC